MKTSLVCTVLNEEKTIKKFLASIFNQTKLPDEIIIVDGGSTDNTVSEISEFKFPKLKKHPNIKLLFKTGNRSIGRNEGIKKASGDIILVSDSGCVLDKEWVKKIIQPFEDKSISVSSGYYLPIAENIFQKCLATYTCVMPDKINEVEFLPSSRSVAFRKDAWKKVKRYPENLDTCEDLVFDKRLISGGFKFKFVKNAIVYWPQRKNLKEAIKQFYNYAKGDGLARYFRPQTPYLFLRYIFVIYLILLSLIERSIYLYSFIVALFLIYTGWSIYKNYRYIKAFKALYYLPVLQFTSDLAVLLGTLIGYVKSLSLNSLQKIILNNKGVTAIIFVYVLTMLSVISYGIPGSSHPFAYFMDEWHQSQSVRDLFKFGSPNMSGAANGSIFQFFLTGIYLIPFYLLRIVNPFAIKSSVISLDTQHILFEVLRLNTLLFGVLSIIVLSYIAKKYFRIHPFIVTFLFVFNPLWITLSNYFKYDIALMFWILLSFLFLLKYAKQNKLLDFILAGIFSALALSVKLEPFNLLLVYIAVFFLYTPKFYQKIKHLLLGLSIYFSVFVFFGIPDILLNKGSLNEYLSSNLQSAPATSGSINLGMNFWQYFLSILYPVDFGRLFYFSFIISVIIAIAIVFKAVFVKRITLVKLLNGNKNQIVLFLIICSYAVSLIPMQIGALANRLIPLLPFMAIAVGLALIYIYNQINRKIIKTLFIVIFVLLFLIQLVETYSWNSLKTNNNPRAISSSWITENIKQGSVIGLENIPIYQFLPDVILKEFYLKQYGKGDNNRYIYEVISSNTKTFPKIIILTNDYIENTYLIKSDKKLIIKRLNREGYERVKTFTLFSPIFSLFNNRLGYYMSAIIQLPDTISIYEKL